MEKQELIAKLRGYYRKPRINDLMHCRRLNGKVVGEGRRLTTDRQPSSLTSFSLSHLFFSLPPHSLTFFSHFLLTLSPSSLSSSSLSHLPLSLPLHFLIFLSHFLLTLSPSSLSSSSLSHLPLSLPPHSLIFLSHFLLTLSPSSLTSFSLSHLPLSLPPHSLTFLSHFFLILSFSSLSSFSRPPLTFFPPIFTYFTHLLSFSFLFSAFFVSISHFHHYLTLCHLSLSLTSPPFSHLPPSLSLAWANQVVPGLEIN